MSRPTARTAAPRRWRWRSLGAAGGLSPLPRPFTELVLERTARHDTALRDFLDIFNHRLVSLMYRVRKKHRVGLATVPPEETGLAEHLYALMGLGTPGLRGAAGGGRPLAAGLRGAPGAAPALRRGAGADARRPLRRGGGGGAAAGALAGAGRGPADAHRAAGGEPRAGRRGDAGGARLGPAGDLRAAGGAAVAGTFRDFLPPGTAFGPLCELARFHAGTELDFSVRLVLRAGEVPASRLGAAGGTRLGWTSWLKTRPTGADGQVRLAPR